ncbi:MAG: exodeoxyribonuclease III, partial [Pirellulaceae bacterium]|nr:exodeoxyribonuclease III [Pirellulaceae bacterium]
MKLATWNVNSVRARLDRLVAWLAKASPDVLCLQELKVVDDDFPTAILSELGYHATVHGQKTYNGVAVLTRVTPASTVRRLAGDDDDPQARFLDVALGSLHVLCAYVPNGQEVG